MPPEPSSPSFPSATAAIPTSFRRTLREGQVIDGYRIDRVATASATAVVYAATDPQLGIAVAIKEYMPVRLARRDDEGRVVPVDADAFERGLQAFISAARALARCDHPALVRVLRVTLGHGTAYQVMPWVNGTSLRDLRATMPGPPDEAALRTLLDGLLNALAAFHATGGVHGGIGPAKIVLQPDDRPVLLGPGSAARDLALRGQAGEQPEPWTDLQAIAAVLRFCILGTMPAETDAFVPLGAEVAARFGDLPAARYSAALLTLVDRASSPQAAARFQSVAEFRAALSPPVQLLRPADPAKLPEPTFAAPPIDPEIDIDAERARLKKVVADIDFGADTAPSSTRPPLFPLPPRNGERRRPPNGAAEPPRLRSRFNPWSLFVLIVIAVLGSVAMWAIVRRPVVTDALAPIHREPVPVAAAQPDAVPPPSLPSPPQEPALAESPVAGEAAAIDSPAASSTAASTPPAVAAPAVELPPAASASAPPFARRALTAARPAATTPREACGARSDFSLYRCMQTQCALAHWSAHPQCVRLRSSDRVDG